MTLFLYFAGFCATLLIAATVAMWVALAGACLHLRASGCRCLGHDWERYQIDGLHYRHPAALSFRKCKRCDHTELLELGRPLTVADVVAHVMANDRNKPSPTPAPSDGRSYTR